MAEEPQSEHRAEGGSGSLPAERQASWTEQCSGQRWRPHSPRGAGGPWGHHFQCMVCGEQGREISRKARSESPISPARFLKELLRVWTNILTGWAAGVPDRARRLRSARLLWTWVRVCPLSASAGPARGTLRDACPDPGWGWPPVLPSPLRLPRGAPVPSAGLKRGCHRDTGGLCLSYSLTHLVTLPLPQLFIIL